MRLPSVLAFVSVLGVTTSACADDWPQLLGPERKAISKETNLNWDWKKQAPKVSWKVSLGSGFSSLTIVGDRVFTMAKRGNRDIAVCLSAADGKELWAYDAVPTYVDMQRQGQGPRATPTHHDGKLYCQFAMGELLCLSAEGKLLWARNIFKDAQMEVPKSLYGWYWGVSFSPLVEGNVVVVQPGGKEGSSVIAYHKDTGDFVWKTGSDPIGYSSPIMIDVQGSRQMVVPTGSSFLGLDPVKGQILWRYEFGNTQFKTNCAQPVWADNLLFVSAAYGTGCAVIEPVKASGGAWEVKEKWRDKKLMLNLFATSIVRDKKVYGVSGDLRAVILKCFDLETGKLNWEDRLAERAHLLAVDGRILVWEEHGTLRFFEATPKAYEVKGELPNLLTFKSWGAPALAGGRLYVRDESQVLCLDLRK